MNSPATTEGKIAVPLDQSALTVLLRTESKGALLTREPVTPADLSEAVSETWLELFLRQGQPGIPFPGLPAQLIPIFLTGTQCSGFALEVTHPDGQTAQREFSMRSLRPVAERAAQRLVETGVLKPGQQYVYEVVFERGRKPALSPKWGEDQFNVTIKQAPLPYLSVPFRPLLQQARPENSVEEGLFPVFYTDKALAKAERYARKGGAATGHPPVETGAVLVGPLCSCPESGEFFCVVSEVLEVLDADQKVFSLCYTSRSWSRIQTVMKARQAAQPAVRILGQAHGHNFLPNDGKICEPCLKRPVCNLTNVFVSQDDQTWTRAVFAHQPWQLCHIFGLSARGDQVNGLYGLQDARLLQRGFFVLPEFDPAKWEQKPAANLT